MPVPSKADGNVPFIGPRKRYNVLTTNTIWNIHEMAGGATLDGTPPMTLTTDVASTDPTLKAGIAVWTNLTHGGLFTHLAHHKQPMVIEAVLNPGGATLTLVHSDDASVFRAMPNTFPIKVSAHECVKATGGAAGSKIGILVRLDADKVL